MKKLKILVPLLLALTVAACRHDEGDSVLELSAESFGGTKMSVEDIHAEWCDGDSVWVNGDTLAITLSGGRAQTLVPHATSYNAVFPASIVTGNNRVTLPSEYHYATDGNGKQLLDLPMIATSTGERLFFYHLTGALIVKYVNHRSQAVTVDRMTVSSNNFALCGERTITFGDTAQAPSTVGGRCVTIYFDRQPTTVASGDTLAVMIPVAPVGATNQFTVEVSSHVAGNRYTVSNTQQTPTQFVRNALGYAYMTVENSSRPTALFQESGSAGNKTMHITTANEFKLMQEAINNGWTLDGYGYSTFQYSIEGNIDMSGIEINPIHGFTGTSFTGNTSNGDNPIISNLTIRSSTEYCALFDIISSSSISNISLSNVKLISEGNNAIRYISPFIGSSSGTHTYSYLTVDGISVTINGSPSGNIFFGGIAATSGSTTTFEYCRFDGDVTLHSNAILYYGGILGYLTNEQTPDFTFSYCSNNDTIHALLDANSTLYAGGVAGYTRKANVRISGQHSLINISGSTRTTFYAGGLIARLDNQTSALDLSNTPVVAGTISYSTTPSSAYIGTIYGQGKRNNLYNLSTYNTLGISIPTNSGNIHTGDPSYQ